MLILLKGGGATNNQNPEFEKYRLFNGQKIKHYSLNIQLKVLNLGNRGKHSTHPSLKLR